MPKSWAMTDVYGLDEPLLAMLPQPVVALMLLFPINEKVNTTHCLKIPIKVSSKFLVKISNPSEIGKIVKPTGDLPCFARM